MAIAGGYLLAGKAVRLIGGAVEKAARLLRDKLPQATKVAQAELQPAYARTVARQPINRVAAIRQSQSRWYSTKQTIRSVARHLSSSAAKPGRASYPPSRTAFAVSQFTSRTPFASTLRPNLTGGTLSRTAGGYSTGAGRIGGARYFSHTPAAPAEVVQNVSQAVRAFWLSGQKARFDGINANNGEKRFQAISALQEETGLKMRKALFQAPGSYIDFKVNPTITAVGPLSNVPRINSADAEDTLTTSGLLESLSVDFARALKDLAAITNDLKRLSTLGELPIALHNNTTLRVGFPGCDADSVEALCQELGIRRGLVYQDLDFDAHTGTGMALFFPFAPSKPASEAQLPSPARVSKRHKREDVEWHEMLSAKHKSPGHSYVSATSQDFEEIENNPWLSTPSGYESLHESNGRDIGLYFEKSKTRSSHVEDFEGLEGIHRFLEECDRARR